MQTLAAIAVHIAFPITFMVFAYHRARRYLHIFQQEEYDPPRFLAWMRDSRTFDKRLTVVLAAIAISSWAISALTGPATTVTSPATTLTLIAVAAALLITACLEPNPEKAAKKKLVMTQRATRILYVALALAAVLAIALALLPLPAPLQPLAWIAAVQSIPLTLVLANVLLAPVEKNIQDGFRKSAEARLATVAPKTVGITGSFGKTSVKHILGHVMQMNTTTLYTPGSVNTVMGISRIINERLADNCRYFIVEMGAYGIGSIARLCKFTPPDHGIITSIGAAHYERFKGLDTVARAKFELAEAVTSRNGKLIIHESVLDQPYAKSFVDADRPRFIVVGTSDAADVRITSIEQTRQGLHVCITHGPNTSNPIPDNQDTQTLCAPLFGHHHAHNMALSYAFASAMGIPPDRIIQALRSTPQIAHRLELKTHASGAVYLDDAYNSNPKGFANALDLLDSLKHANGRRIVVTPGMAELGARHADAHSEIGTKAAHTADILIAIKPERIPTLISAFRNEAKHSNPSAEVIEFERFLDAQAWLKQNLQPTDAVLIENDLPDLYERQFTV